MLLDLDALEIQILLKCNEGSLKRSRLSSLYARHPIEKRKEAINNLITSGYIIDKELPLPGTKTTPVYYEITQKGKVWINEYLEEYPDHQKNA